jgi:uncharacterized protein (TIGR02217 family)
MADVANRLPSKIEAGAQKSLTYATEIVQTDGGAEHRNARWSEPLAEWEITIPMVKRTSDDYAAITNLFAATQGSLLSFDFHDPADCVDVEVRLKDDGLHILGVGNQLTISLTLVQVR